MSSPLFQVDAFTSEPFRGNPAAVCFPASPPHDSWMQLVAREMNLSETAFVWPEEQGWRLRWFTPTAEVRLCGHATLATAHVLWETGRLPAAQAARFHTLSGVLTARRHEAGIELDFPVEPLTDDAVPDGLLAALGVRGARFTGRTATRYVMELAAEEEVLSLQPDFAALLALPPGRVVVTAASERADFVSRYFAPGVGVPEDPVTGSTHCTLGPYWARRLGRSRLRAWQASARGGFLEVEVRGERVSLLGQAVTVLRGELLAPVQDTSPAPAR